MLFIFSMITIIFSFKNEQENLQELIDRSVSVCHSLNTDFEIIFVDDNSSDNSKNIIKKNIQKYKEIKYIKMTRTFGVAPCIVAGLEKAKGDFMIYLDSDLQDPPELIKEMYQKAIEGNEIVHTQRTSRQGENYIKMLLTKYAYQIISWSFPFEIKKNSGDFKLLSKKVVEQILKINEKDPFLRALPSWTGFKNTTIQYERKSRYRGETKFPLLSSINPYKELIRAFSSFSSIPIYFGIISGLITLLLTLFLFFIKIINLYDGISGIVLLILFLFSCSQFTISFIGIYIERILKQTSKRPEFIIEEMIGF